MRNDLLKKGIHISVILPTYNRTYAFRQILFPGLERQSYKNFEIVIVDDGSDDGTDDFLSSGDFHDQFPVLAKRVRFLRNERNIGAPASRNKGAENAEGDWLYIVEDDVQIDDPDYLKKASTILEKVAKDVAVVSPKRAESKMTGYYKNPEHSFVRIGRLSGEIYMDPTQEYSGFVPNTHASSFIRKDVFLRHKEDEKAFFGNTFRDESDLYFRIVKSGKKIFYVGDVLKTVHRNDIALKGGQKKINSSSLFQRDLIEIRNHYRYLRKNKYSFLEFRILAYFCVRWLRHASNMLRIAWLKNLTAFYRI